MDVERCHWLDILLSIMLQVLYYLSVDSSLGMASELRRWSAAVSGGPASAVQMATFRLVATSSSHSHAGLLFVLEAAAAS